MQSLADKETTEITPGMLQLWPHTRYLEHTGLLINGQHKHCDKSKRIQILVKTTWRKKIRITANQRIFDNIRKTEE